MAYKRPLTVAAAIWLYVRYGKRAVVEYQAVMWPVTGSGWA